MAGPLPGLDAAGAVGTVAHVIQVALTPVFLLSGIGTLLTMFNARQARVLDHAERTNELLTAAIGKSAAEPLRAHLARLRRRRLAMDLAVILGAIGGASTCGAAFALFVGGLRDLAGEIWLFSLFGLALACTVGALMAFLADTVLDWHGFRRDGPMPRLAPERSDPSCPASAPV